MTAHRWVWLSCDGDPDSDDCFDNTMSDLYVAGASPRTVRAAEQHPVAKDWHTRPDGRHICPNCWEAGHR